MSSGRFTKVAVAYLVLLLSFAVGLFVLERRDIERTETAAMNTCARVNHLRRAVNDNAVVLYTATDNAERRERALARGSRLRDVHLRAAKQLSTFKKLYLFRPYTNCWRAVHTPDKYKAPKPRPFSRREVEAVRRRLPRG